MKINEILDVISDFNTGLEMTIQYAQLSDNDNTLLEACLVNFQQITVNTDKEQIVAILKDVQTGLSFRVQSPIGMSDSLRDLINGILQNLNVVFEDMI